MSDRNPVTDNCGLRGVRSCEECFSLNDFDGDGFVLDGVVSVGLELKNNEMKNQRKNILFTDAKKVFLVQIFAVSVSELTGHTVVKLSALKDKIMSQFHPALTQQHRERS